MSTTDESLIGRTQRRSPAEDPSSSALRISGAIRLGIAVLVAGGLTAALIVAQWGPLNVKATVVGYPIFNNFNPYVYSRGYELAVVLFPLATLVIFYALTWVGPRIGLATPARRGRVRPTGPDPDIAAATEAEPESEVARWLGERHALPSSEP